MDPSALLSLRKDADYKPEDLRDAPVSKDVVAEAEREDEQEEMPESAAVWDSNTAAEEVGSREDVH